MVLFICFPSLFTESLLTFFFQNTHLLAPCLLQHLDSVEEKALPLRPTSYHFPVSSSVSKNPRASVQKGTVSFYYDYHGIHMFHSSQGAEQLEKMTGLWRNAECHNRCLYALSNFSTSHGPQTLETLVQLTTGSKIGQYLNRILFSLYSFPQEIKNIWGQ